MNANLFRSVKATAPDGMVTMEQTKLTLKYM